MGERVVIVTSHQPALNQQMFEYAGNRCKTDTLWLLVQADTHLWDGPHPDPIVAAKRYHQRDIFRTRALRLLEAGYRTCIIIPSVCHDRRHPDLAQCFDQVHRQSDAIRKVTRFDTYHLACITKDFEFIDFGQETPCPRR